MSQETIAVTLPLMGEGVHEATVVKWLKNPGDLLKQDEPLVEVSTDKVDTEITAPSDGYLIAIYAQAGKVVKVAEVLAYLSEDAQAQPPAAEKTQANLTPARHPQAEGRPGISYGEATGNFARSFAEPALRRGSANGLRMTEGTPGTYAGTVRSSPLVRKMAKESGTNLHQVQGSGLYGRITKDDLLAHWEHGPGRFSQPSAQPSSFQESDLSRQNTTVQDGTEYLEGVAVRREKMSKIRQLTAAHMLRSVRVSPHVTTTFEIDLFKVSTAKTALEKKCQAEQQCKLTYTAFFIEAAIAALKKHPLINASIDGDDILYKDTINFGCAVAIDTGLIVPVIKDAQNLNLFEIAARLQDLALRARSKKLKPQEVQGGTFSLTNPGMYGSLHSQPIINQPQVAILSVGAIVQRPVVINKELAIHPLCQVGLTFDHRLIDGEGGALYLRDLKDFLEAYPSA